MIAAAGAGDPVPAVAQALSEFSYMNAFRPAETSTEYTLAEAIAQRGALVQ